MHNCTYTISIIILMQINAAAGRVEAWLLCFLLETIKIIKKDVKTIE